MGFYYATERKRFELEWDKLRTEYMTRMASYEKGEGRDNVRIGNFFRSDYIALQILKAIVSAIIAFAIMFGLYLLCNFEDLMENLYEMDLLAFARDILTYFVAIVGGYAAITYIVCTWRYATARKSLKCYYHNLKKLGSLYNEQK